MEKGQYGKAVVNGLMCVGLALSSKLRMLAYLHMQGAWWNGNLVTYVSLFSFFLLSTFFSKLGSVRIFSTTEHMVVVVVVVTLLFSTTPPFRLNQGLNLDSMGTPRLSRLRPEQTGDLSSTCLAVHATTYGPLNSLGESTYTLSRV